MNDQCLTSGWDIVKPGASLFPFKEEFKENPAEVLVADRKYSQTNSYVDTVSSWRTLKPIYNEDFCIHCQNCWVYCPDMSIISLDKKFNHIDYDHCKGCGICAEVCPTNPKSLIMFSEQSKIDDELAKWPEKEKKNK
jgi:pyruvate ferredoxin oxidoreductase delta subunit